MDVDCTVEQKKKDLKNGVVYADQNISAQPEMCVMTSPPLAQCRKQPIARPATLIFNYYSRRGQNIGRERERKRWRQ